MKGQIDNIHPELMKVLVELERRMGFELNINSGHRDPEYNDRPEVGGVKDSEHTYNPAEGVDVLCLRSATRFKMIKALLEMGIRRIGDGQTFIHVGISKDKPQDVFWNYYPTAKVKPKPPTVMGV